MRHWTRKALIALPPTLLLSAALADDKPLTREELASKLNGIEVADISESPVNGLYQVAIGANVVGISIGRKPCLTSSRSWTMSGRSRLSA